MGEYTTKWVQGHTGDWHRVTYNASGAAVACTCFGWWGHGYCHHVMDELKAELHRLETDV